MSCLQIKVTRLMSIIPSQKYWVSKVWAAGSKATVSKLLEFFQQTISDIKVDISLLENFQ